MDPTKNPDGEEMRANLISFMQQRLQLGMWKIDSEHHDWQMKGYLWEEVIIPFSLNLILF